MVEVLIAGILLASVLVAVGRMSVSALSGSKNLSARVRIEAAINDNIQALQKEDSYLTSDWLSSNPDLVFDYLAESKNRTHYHSAEGECGEVGLQSESCMKVFDYYFDLKGSSKMEEFDECLSSSPRRLPIECACIAPDLMLRMYIESVVDKPRGREVERNFDYISDYYALKVIYSFQGPEQHIGDERRIVEMSPNFASQCYRTR